MLAERQGEIEKSLPSMIDQLTVSVEAGLGFDAALARAAEGRTGPLADELTRVLQDMQVGVSRQDALDRMVERTDVPDLRSFVVALRHSNRHGVPMAGVLRKQRPSGDHPPLAAQAPSSADFGAVPASQRALSAATRPHAASEDTDLTLDIPTARRQSRGVLMSSPLELTPTVQEQHPMPTPQAEAPPQPMADAPSEADSRKATIITAVVVALVIIAAALSLFGPWRAAPGEVAPVSADAPQAP